ncbi:hypothetical protein GCM10020216_075260 [Nonomuraea helvata]
MPDYRTDRIGQWRDGQFLGGVVAAFREGYSRTEDWQAHKRWYAILHRFSPDGHYLDSRIECTGAEDRHRESVDAGDRRLIVPTAGVSRLHRFPACRAARR